MDLRSLEIKISRSENLPMLSQIVTQVIQIVDDPDGSCRSLEEIIQRDPAMTAKILRVASSAFYGADNVSTIGRAIGVLGMNTIRSLVIGVAYQQIMNSKIQSKGLSKLEFWKHSLATATAAKILGKLKMPSKAEELYCAGMMHDVGLLVLDRFCAEDLDRAITMATEEEVELHFAEQHCYGYNHGVIGDLLAEKWGLPPMMRHAIAYHHDVCEDATDHVTTCFVSAANTLAHQCGFNNASPSGICEFDEEVLSVLDIPAEQFEMVRPIIIAEVAKAEAALQLLI